MLPNSCMNRQAEAGSWGIEIDGAKHHFVDVGEVRLHCVEAGTGPLVVLLHGFPEFWWSWRYQIPALAKGGFRVVAPDLRGYNLSDKPPNVKDYAIERLRADVAGLIHGLGEKKAHVIGHDWGAGVAWDFAMHRPELTDRLGILNVPHPIEMMRGLTHSFAQLRKSWYIFFFQLPGVPERMLRRNNYEMLRRSLRADRARPATDEELDRYVHAAAKADDLRGGINFYRAAMRSAATGSLPKPQRIDAPVLVIWGERDRFLGKDLATPPPKWVPHARVEFLPDASHWVQVDAPQRVNELLLSFLRPA
jgi:pimeloyl-ACP methyl ester carboxylesterase